MRRTRAFRILMYSHDTYGLGHLTRTLRIARALRHRWNRVSILILSGSPVAPYMGLPEDTDLVKLPSVVKAGQDWYRARDLRVTFSRIKKIRRELIRSAADSFRPDVFMVDNVPLGMKAEILPTLRHLRSRRRSTRIVLNLRDILDDPPVIRSDWERNGVPDLLEESYDRIFVLGDRRLFDAQAAYMLPPDKTSIVGYACPGGGRNPGRDRRDGDLPRVLLTAGGGGDGAEFLLRAIEGLRPSARPTGSDGPAPRLEVVTGPLMDPRMRKRILDISTARDMDVYEFVPDLPDRMARADLVVSMGGYNTCCEILSHANRGLLLPRIAPRVEQYLRAEAFEARGICGTLPLDSRPDQIQQAVARMLASGPDVARGDLPRLDGLGRLAEEMARLCPELDDPPSRERTGDGETEGGREVGAIRLWSGTSSPASRPLQGGSR